MQHTRTSRRGALIALLCAAAFAGSLMLAINAVAQDAPAAATQQQQRQQHATPQFVQDAQPSDADPEQDAARDGRNCPQGGGGQDDPQSGGTADPSAGANSTAV